MHTRTLLSLLAAVCLGLPSCSWEHAPTIPAQVRSSALIARVSFERPALDQGSVPVFGAPPGATPTLMLAIQLRASLDGRANRTTEIVTSLARFSMVRASDGASLFPPGVAQAVDRFLDGELRLPLDSSSSAEISFPLILPVRPGDVEALCSGPVRIVGDADDTGLGESIPVRGDPFTFDCDARYVDASLSVLELQLAPPADPTQGVADLRLTLQERVALGDAATAPALWLQDQGTGVTALHDDQGRRLVPQDGLDVPIEHVDATPSGAIAIARGSEVVVTRHSRRPLRDPGLVEQLCKAKVRVVDGLVLDEPLPDLGPTSPPRVGPTGWSGEVRSELMAVDCHLLAPP